MDICVVTFRNTAESIEPSLRSHDVLYVRDNTYHNVGFAAGANLAARRGAGELIGFFNPDGRLSDGALSRLEAVFDDPSIVAAEANQGFVRDEVGDPEWLSGACLVVRRSAFEKVKGFDERLFMYGEDVDLSYKLSALGRLVHVHDAIFDHANDGRPYRALHRNYRNWLVVQRRHRKAKPRRMVRDALYAFRRLRWLDAIARLTATFDYLLRARHWA
jgi:GT2 family glycosyltransferase